MKLSITYLVNKCLFFGELKWSYFNIEASIYFLNDSIYPTTQVPPNTGQQQAIEYQYDRRHDQQNKYPIGQYDSAVQISWP